MQKILNHRGLGSRHYRWLALEWRDAEQVIKFSGEQVTFLAKLNPRVRERHVENTAPGELVCADTVSVGHLKGFGKA